MATRKQQLERLAGLMKKIDIAMLTTIAPGGDLVSRPLSTQAASFDGEYAWFLSDGDSQKVAELRRNPKVNVAWSSKDANTYLSASGDADVRHDRALIDRFWNDALKAFFPKGPDDPNLVVIEVRVRTIEYWDGPGSWIGKAATFVAARITGNDDLMGENRIVDVATGRSRKPPGSDRPGGGRGTGGRKTAARKAGTRKVAGAKSAAAKAGGKQAKRAKAPAKDAKKRAGTASSRAKKTASRGRAVAKAARKRAR